ncbi:MAG TPA: hypothetical protein PLJ62_11320 [Thermoflexales bacterium]|nr:hypothetical protein [Thermoflexales bacterium]
MKDGRRETKDGQYPSPVPGLPSGVIYMKHVLFFAPFALWRPHFEIDLELVQRRLDEGCAVTILTCRGDLPTCEPNEQHRAGICHSCMYRFRQGVKWLGDKNAKVENFYRLSPIQQNSVNEWRAKDFGAMTLAEYRAIEMDGSDIGRAAYSSLVSMLRDPEPDLRQHAAFARDNLLTALISHYALTNHLEEKRPDEFVIFNGRFAALQPALRAAQKLGISTLVHEQANALSRIYVTRNTSVHDIETAANNIERIFAESPLPYADKKEIAQKWFEDRRQSKNKGGIHFVKDQREGLLPQTWNAGAFNVGIFVSSEDEFASLTEWVNPHYASQNDGIRRVLESFATEPGFRFYVRMHPNLAKLDNAQTRELTRIATQNANVEMIPAESPISTYGLLDACDAVITYGTTVGIEALFAGKPSFLMGRCFYERLPGLMRPASHEELVLKLKNLAGFAPQLSTQENQDAQPARLIESSWVKYGFAQTFWGEETKYMRGTTRYDAHLVKDGRETHLAKWPRSLGAKIIWKLERMGGLDDGR